MARLAILLPVLVVLFGCSGDDSEPAYDGPRFLLTGAQGLSSLSLEGHGSILSYSDGTFLLDPAVSPDGKTYAFARQPPATQGATGKVNFGSDLILLDSKSKEPREVLHHSSIGEFIRNPNFLPGGESLIISVRGRAADNTPDFRIERLEIASGRRARLLEDAIGPALSPDGRSLAYIAIEPETQLESLLVLDLETGKERILVPAGRPLILMQNIAWSPDGKTLAFMSSDRSTALSASGPASNRLAASVAHPTLQDLWLMDVDGTDLRRLAELAELAPSVTWSADGNELYVMSSSGFFRFDPVSGRQETLGPGVAGGQIALLP